MASNKPVSPATLKQMDDFCHGDDFVWHGTKDFEWSIVYWFKEKFVTSQEFQNFSYLGMQIEEEYNCVFLDQQLYIDELSKTEITITRRITKDVPLKEN